MNEPVEIIENGEHLDSITGQVFVKRGEKYKNAVHTQKNSLHGPVADIFTDQYAVAWKGDGSIKRLAKQLAGSGPCFADANLPDNYINTHNIIFVGRPDKSKHFAKITDKFPVIIHNGILTANGQVYEGDFGAIFVYPNPLNSQKYLAILSGSTDKAREVLNNAWNQIKSKDNADIGIFNVSENSKIQWHICEKFNTVWDWHKSWVDKGDYGYRSLEDGVRVMKVPKFKTQAEMERALSGKPAAVGNADEKETIRAREARSRFDAQQAINILSDQSPFGEE